MTRLHEVLSKYTASLEAQETAKDRTIAKLREENKNLKHAVKELVKANLDATVERWEKIETVPDEIKKSGHQILYFTEIDIGAIVGCHKLKLISMCSFYCGEWIDESLGFDGGDICYPTHWQPLPKPPNICL